MASGASLDVLVGQLDRPLLVGSRSVVARVDQTCWRTRLPSAPGVADILAPGPPEEPHQQEASHEPAHVRPHGHSPLGLLAQ